MLGVIASSMITVAGVVFSIAIVSLQLASSQFGPRMLANFVRDRGQQVTLGTFVSGFLYSLLVLRVVRTGDTETVPHLSVTVALLLAVAGLSVLIYFVHHVATTIQAPNLVDAIAQELREGIEKRSLTITRVNGLGHRAPTRRCQKGSRRWHVGSRRSTSATSRSSTFGGWCTLPRSTTW